MSLSTIEAEFVAASEMTREMLGLCEMRSEVGIAPAVPMELHVDNQAAISQAAGDASSMKARDINFRLKFLCNLSRRGVITETYLKSKLMLADLLTKAHDAAKLITFRGLMRIV